MLDIPCVIFAGGKSSRMGEDKSLLPFGNSPTLTQFQLQKLQKIFKNVYISCKDSDKFHFKADFIFDSVLKDVYAPTAGFIGIYKTLEVEKFFVISVDTPFINEEIITTILENDSNELEATIASIESGMQPMCGIYHRSLESKFIKMLEEDNHKLGFLLKKSRTKYVHFSDEKPFLNLNEPHEYKEALTLV